MKKWKRKKFCNEKVEKKKFYHSELGTHRSWVFQYNLNCFFIAQLFPQAIWSKYQEQVFRPKLSYENWGLCSQYRSFQGNKVSKLPEKWVSVEFRFLQVDVSNRSRHLKKTKWYKSELPSLAFMLLNNKPCTRKRKVHLTKEIHGFSSHTEYSIVTQQRMEGYENTKF